jgi:hypothetical protein
MSARTFWSGSMMKTARTVAVSEAPGCMRPYFCATFVSRSATTGKSILTPKCPSMFLNPRDVRGDGIDREADELRAALLELFGAARELDELGRADGREVRGVREEHDPLALVVGELQLALR